MSYKILYRYRDDAPDWSWELYAETDDYGTAWERIYNCSDMHPKAEIKLVEERVILRWND